jgi:hypothetical protein
MKKNLLSGLSKPKLLGFLLLAALYNIADAQLLFNESAQSLESSGYEYSIAYVNSDTFPDIYISTHFDEAGDPGKIWLNNGDGTFTATQTIGHERITHRVAFADLDGDNDVDIFLANDADYSGNTTYIKGCPNEVWFNNGDGHFTNSGQLLGFEPSNGVKLADIDNDGDIDAAIGNYHPADDHTGIKYKPDEIWLNDGKGAFTLSQTLGYGMSSPQMVDFDTDGDLDAIDQDTLWLNDGHGIFTKSNKVFKFGDNVNAIEYGDLNNDGNIDAFIGNWNAPAEVWLNDGTENLINSGQKLGKMKCGNVQLIDIEGDGDLDAFTDNYEGLCKLWINQGEIQKGNIGNFLESDAKLPSGKGILYDLNKDGKLDAIIGNKVWFNTYNATAIGENKPYNRLTIFPNPTNGLCTLSFGATDYKKLIAEVYNSEGKLIFSKSYDYLETATIDFSNLHQGLYLIKVRTDTNVFSKLISKQN